MKRRKFEDWKFEQIQKGAFRFGGKSFITQEIGVGARHFC